MAYWTTKDGRTIEISKMETSHIRNAMRILERRHEAFNKRPISDFFYAMRTLMHHTHGEFAQEAAERDWEKAVESKPITVLFPMYAAFEAELKARGETP